MVRNPAANVSAHYCVDVNSIVQCVRDRDVAWHARARTTTGSVSSTCGRAKQTGRDWNDAYSVAMLDLSAGLVADLCRAYEIPVGVALRRRPEGGQARDHDARRRQQAFKRGSHWDPGTGFPIDLSLVRKKLGAAAPRASPCGTAQEEPAAPAVRSGGLHVKRLQRLLRQHDLYPE